MKNILTLRMACVLLVNVLEMRNLYEVKLRKAITGFIEVKATIAAETEKEAIEMATKNHTIQSLIISDTGDYDYPEVINLTVRDFKEIEKTHLEEKRKRKAQRALATRLNNQNKYTYISRKSSKSGK